MDHLPAEIVSQRTSESNTPILTPTSSDTSMMPRIAIVGAGVSGMRCAALLAQARCKVVLYEARARVGGRVHQEVNDGHIVDMGSNWIHGTAGNPISKLAEKTGTVVWAPEERSLVIDEDGKLRSEEESGQMSEEFWGQILQAFKYADEKSGSIDARTSLKDFLAQQWMEKFSGDRQKQKDLLNESAQWGQFVGGKVDTQSLKFFWLEECLEGENVFVAGTYLKILQDIARPVVGDDTGNVDLRFTTIVDHVKYRESQGSEDMCVVRTHDGAQEEFDEVVITCPLGWLKRHKGTVFQPALPERLDKAITNIGYGHLEKMYVSFREAWWMHKISSSTPAVTSKTSFRTSRLQQSDNEATQSDPSTTYGPILTFHSPQYHTLPETKSSSSFNQATISLSHLPDDTAHPTLLFYMSGDSSAYITSALSSQTPHSKTYDQTCTDFITPFLQRLPNYNKKDPSCTPTSYTVTSWSQDEYAGYGSYSNFPTGLTAADEDILCLRNSDGLGHAGQGLWFAGEHTAPFAALGTTTGAFWSGEGIARRICRRHNLDFEEDWLSQPEVTGLDTDEPSTKDKLDLQTSSKESSRKVQGGNIGKSTAS